MNQSLLQIREHAQVFPTPSGGHRRYHNYSYGIVKQRNKRTFTFISKKGKPDLLESAMLQWRKQRRGESLESCARFDRDFQKQIPGFFQRDREGVKRLRVAIYENIIVKKKMSEETKSGVASSRFPGYEGFLVWGHLIECSSPLGCSVCTGLHESSTGWALPARRTRCTSCS